MQSGIKSIAVTNCTNCTASADPFTVGAHDQVLTTSTKTDQTKSSSVQLKVSDVVGSVTTFDPVDVTVESDGTASIHVLRNVDRSEHVAEITNGTPGLGTWS